MVADDAMTILEASVSVRLMEIVKIEFNNRIHIIEINSIEISIHL